MGMDPRNTRYRRSAKAEFCEAAMTAGRYGFERYGMKLLQRIFL
jgi:hypothetical protein